MSSNTPMLSHTTLESYGILCDYRRKSVSFRSTGSIKSRPLHLTAAHAKGNINFAFAKKKQVLMGTPICNKDDYKWCTLTCFSVRQCRMTCWHRLTHTHSFNYFSELFKPFWIPNREASTPTWWVKSGGRSAPRENWVLKRVWTLPGVVYQLRIIASFFEPCVRQLSDALLRLVCMLYKNEIYVQRTS